MKYQLSFCEIEQLSENVFEIIAKEGIAIDKNSTDESWNFWNDLRENPFGLLVNCINPYMISFEGSKEIGKHHFQQKTAILCSNDTQIAQMKAVVEIKKFIGLYPHHLFFTDRDEAIRWLSDISVLPKEAPTKYELTNCRIEQLSENVFEATPQEGIVVDRICVDECETLWNEIRDNPFGLLINCKNTFSLSFEGSRDVGQHPFQQKTAILCNGYADGSEKKLRLTQQIKEMAGVFCNLKVFIGRDEAIKWLSDI